MVAKAKIWERKWWIVIILVSALAHLWCLNSVFFLDDIPQIRDNPYLEKGDWWNVPVFLRWTYLSYWLQTKLWGTSSIGFHAVNWLLHTGAALSFFILSRKLTQSAGVAFVAATIFAVHPLGSEIPNYARTQDLAWVTLFSILAATMCWQVMHHFQWRWLAGCFIFLLGATLSKGPGFFHCVMMIAFVAVAGAKSEHWQFLKRKKRAAGGLLLFAVILIFYLQAKVGWYGMEKWSYDEFGWHALTLCRVFWQFVGLLFYPDSLCADHFIAGTISWQDREAILAMVGVICWIVIATALIFFSKTRVLGISLWLFLGAILLRMLFLINEFMPEYRIYPGLPWACLAIAICGSWVLSSRFVLRNAVCAMMFVLLMLLSAVRSFQWHDLDVLCEDVLRQYPEQGRAIWMLHRRDADLGRWDAIIERQARFENVEEAFFATQKSTSQIRTLSGGHQMLSQVACLGYYGEALAARGDRQSASHVFRALRQVVSSSEQNQQKLKVIVDSARERVRSK